MIRLKKELTLIIYLVLFLFVICILASCGENSDYTQNVVTNTVTDTKPEMTKYKVTFDSNGGAEVEPQFVELNKRVNEPAAPTRPGYTFNGWYAGSEKWVFLQHTVVDDITLKAKWTPNENILIFDSNGGIGTMSNMTIATDSCADLTNNAFTKVGYTFVGWSTSANGEVEYTDSASYTMGAEEIYTLYAVWEIIEYRITYHMNGGFESSPNPTTFTVEDLPITLNDLNNKEDLLFSCWYTESDIGGIPVAEITAIGDVTLYAEYISDGFVFTEIDGNLKISGYNGNSTKVVIPSTYKGMSVTEIESGAFSGCSNLESLTIPFVGGIKGGSSITHLFGYIFGNSYYDGSVGIQQSCSGNCIIWYVPSNLMSVTIRDSETSIGCNAFYGFDTLVIYCEATEKPSGWNEDWNNSGCPVVWDCNNNDVADDGYIYTVIDGIRYAIKDSEAAVVRQSRNITTVTIPESITYKETAYPVTNIEEWAFYECTNLTSITIGNSVTTIDRCAFYGCGSLISVTIGDGVTSIDSSAFQGCTGLRKINIFNIANWCNILFGNSYANPLCYAKNLYISNEKVTNLVIPDSITTINDYAFYGCDSLISVTIGNGVTYIGNSAFYNCTGMTSIEIPNSVTSIEKWAFGNCASLINLNIPNSVTSIGEKAFYECTDLISVTIGDGVTTIGDYAFSCCTSLTSIEIPDSVTSIGLYAFSDCTVLMSIKIPDNVRSIKAYAFSSCNSLTIYCEATEKPSEWSLKWNASNCPVVWGC